MEEKIFDLKEFREQILHLTQSELADLLGIRQDAVSRMEKNPDQIELKILIKLAKLSGLSLDEILDYKLSLPEPLTPSYNWREVEHYCQPLLQQLNTIEDRDQPSNSYPKVILRDFKKLIRQKMQKPMIGVFGMAHSGKSTLINALVGEKILPVGMTAAVKVMIWVKHIENRPGNMTDEVYMLRLDRKLSIETILENEHDFKQYTIASGGMELLQSYADNNWKRDRAMLVDLVLVFAESDILYSCDLIKFPTLQDTSDWESITKGFSGTLDGIIYLHTMTFLPGEDDLIRLRAALEYLSPCFEIFDSKQFPFFLLGTKAHLIGSVSSAQKALELVGNHYYDEIPSDYWKELAVKKNICCSKQEFLARTFLYAMDSPELRKDFEEHFLSLIENLPVIRRQQAASQFREFVEVAIRTLDAQIQYHKTVSSKCGENEPFQPSEKDLPSVIAAQQKDKVQIAIQRHSRNTIRKFQNEYDKELSREGVMNSIEGTSTRLVTAQIQRLGSNISLNLINILMDKLEKESQVFCDELEEYLRQFERETVNSSFPVRHIAMDIVRKNSSFGGLKYWLIKNGGDPSLKGVPVDPDLIKRVQQYTEQDQRKETVTYQKDRPVMDILVGALEAAAGAAVIISGLSIPFTALGLVTGLGVGKVLRGVNSSSTKTVYTKIKDAFSQQDVQEKYELCILKYWNDTAKDFAVVANQLEKRWRSFKKEARNDRSSLTMQVQTLQSLRDTLAKLQL